MFKRLITLACLVIFAFPVWAKNTVHIPVSCVIPRIIVLSEKTEDAASDAKLEEKTPGDMLIQYQHKKRKKRRVIIKTVLLR